ncbi:benzyl alcohol O-benzoyltransferase-like isoform X1 [Gossypium australe]|uniref:Benzyl alcohol O-benzoyltransferase-like isoform X1 n=1 Tax=Gossypium australe TaxID=47621 RepID=A0A5B6VVT4_9ROSI|nr:benzyl alcohol O-benzoyltransferase-like isoform X1 [Gossypium australe]
MARTVQPTSLAFKVRSSEPELVVPVKPTPREYKLLSDIDDRYGHRFLHPVILLYRCNPSMEGKDPAKVIRDAIAKTLVFYYPFAGRLKEGPNGKLSVDCTGEGVLFIEGDADVTLQQFGDNPLPPFPCMDELLFDVKGYGEMLDCPLFLIQFMKAIGEMARGALSPTISPVWERHLLNARTPSRATYAHLEFDQEFMDMNDDEITQPTSMVNLSFFFGSNEISTLRKLISPHYQCTTHDILTACLWRCHTKALQPDPDQHIRLICIVNTRSKFNPPLPLVITETQ